jgi:hypothetical protein
VVEDTILDSDCSCLRVTVSDRYLDKLRLNCLFVLDCTASATLPGQQLLAWHSSCTAAARWVTFIVNCQRSIFLAISSPEMYL